VIYVPVPRYRSGRTNRPSGLVPPPVELGGVTELRLHGVGGTTPADLLGDLSPQQVSGDRIAGFYRTEDGRGRHIEAYSWGGLTSRSGSRVLWVLLFPFAMANLAGWMCARRTHQRRRLFWLHRAMVRWAALGVTVNLLLIVAMTSMDLMAYQCGSQDACAGNTWVLHFLRYGVLADYPGRRVLVGAMIPLIVILALAALTLRSISRYEEVEPTYNEPNRPRRATASAAAVGFGLPERAFWDGRRSTLDLGCLHIAAALGFVALTLAYTVNTVTHLARPGAPTQSAGLLWTALALGVPPR
jgi:hypothetical protein